MGDISYYRLCAEGRQDSFMKVTFIPMSKQAKFLPLTSKRQAEKETGKCNPQQRNKQPNINLQELANQSST